MLKLTCGITLLFCGMALGAEGQAPALGCGMAPGWTEQGAARAYTAENLFEYMDGNAEGYLIYGFDSMRGITCLKGGVTFVIDISDMGDADSAYGIFTSNRDPRQPAAQIGMGGQIVPRRLIFAKGKYYVEIAANPEGDYTPALKEWAAALEKSVEGSTSVPATLTWFPAEKQQSLRLVPESVLGIRLLKRGYVAQYEFGKAFVVLEATPESATGVMQKLRERFGETTPAKIGDEGFQVTDKYLGKVCIFRKGRYVSGYANVADGQDAVALATAMAAKVQ
ncbi:MAG TPA: DUF6599 family protein [Bryobacteraceae bacterium]|jgi:hypothetical protein